MRRSVGRDPEIEAILAQGRQTRRPSPRWQWIAAAIVLVVCGTGFAVVLLAVRAPDAAIAPASERRPASAGGFGLGMVIGASLGIAIGVSISRQRRDHSSRNRP